MRKRIMTVLAAVIAVIMSATVLNSVAFAAETNTGDNLKSGKYAVDISWSPMGAMFSPVLELDAEKDTFKVYNATAPETSKGAGSVAFADGVYTLTYENGSTTTFTYDAANDTITFTSALYYGKASFNNLDDAGKFITYTAKVVQTETPSEPETNSENATEAQTTTEAETTTEIKTEAESKSDNNGLQSPDTGDTTNVVFLFAACIVASAAIVGLTAVKRRDA